MKMLGLIGGMSWESTALYYRIINEQVKAHMGGLHSARLLLYSFDFAPVAALQKAGEWERAGQAMAQAAESLYAGGAQALVLCTNTMHKLASHIEAAVPVPLLHIADPTGAAIKAAGLSRVALLGTQFTMEQDFYRARLEQQFGLEVLVPDDKGRALVHRVIYEELCCGQVRAESRAAYEQVIDELKARRAQGVVLGCTEITLLLPQARVCGLPVFDTTLLHAQYAAGWAMQEAEASYAA